MDNGAEQTAQIRINNVMGFHVRPVQRFAELARVFDADLEVCKGGRRVPGKSVMNLMSLGGKMGDVLTVCARGVDARQLLAVLQFLAEHHFFVEDEVEEAHDPERHVHRFAGLSNCFESSVRADLDGRSVDAKDPEALTAAGLQPRSEPVLCVDGPDARQALAVLQNLVNQCFYVEEQLIEKHRGNA